MKACQGLGKGGVIGSCSEQQSGELQIGVPGKATRRRPRVSCGPSVQETTDPVSHSDNISKVPQGEDLWVRTNQVKFH